MLSVALPDGEPKLVVSDDFPQVGLASVKEEGFWHGFIKIKKYLFSIVRSRFDKLKSFTNYLTLPQYSCIFPFTLITTRT